MKQRERKEEPKNKTKNPGKLILYHTVPCGTCNGRQNGTVNEEQKTTNCVVGLVSLHANLPLWKYSLKATVTLSETCLPTYS